MRRGGSVLLLVIGLVLTSGAPLATGATAPSVNVTVTNSTADPVPVTGLLQKPVVRDGIAVLGVYPNNTVSIPVGVVLTDVVVFIGDGHSSCPFNLMTGDTILFQWYLDGYSVVPLVREMHLNSGLASKAERQLRFEVSAPCNVIVTWTGYEQ